MSQQRCYGCGNTRGNHNCPSKCANCGRLWNADPTDAEFWFWTLDSAAWLLYGDLDEHFTPFVHSVLSRLEERDGLAPSFGPFGFSTQPTLTPLPADYAVGYWLFLSELVRLNLAEYGTSPRGAWLTPDGVRFRRIFLANHATGSVEWHPDHPAEAQPSPMTRA